MAGEEELLSMLDAYGQQFMSSFDSTILSSKRKEAPEAGPSSSKKKLKVKETPSVEEEEEEEWEGFCSEISDEGEDESEGTSSWFLHGDCLLMISLAGLEGRREANQPAVVVFSDAMKSAPHMGSKAQLKAFMVCASC